MAREGMMTGIQVRHTTSPPPSTFQYKVQINFKHEIFYFLFIDRTKAEKNNT